MGLPAIVDSDFGLDAAHLGRAITLLTAQINVANHRLLRMIGEFDRCQGWMHGGVMRSCAHWLAANCGMTLGAAREKLRVARQIAGLPEIDQAFSQGEISYSKVRAITRVATPDNEGFMVTLAENNSASQLEKLVSRYQPAEDPALDGLLPQAESLQGQEDVVPEMDEESRRELARKLYWFQDEDGMWVIHARLPPEQGQLVVKTLQAISRPMEEQRHDDWKAKQKEQMQEVARNILKRSQKAAHEEHTGADSHRGEGEGNSQEAGGETEVLPDAVVFGRANEKISAETFSQHMNHIRADALVNMVEHFLASGPDYQNLQGLKGSERCQVVLHVDINTLREEQSGMCCTHGKAHFEDKPWLSPATARRLSCDSSLVTVLEDENGRVLNVGRRSRVVPPHIRRALKERDGGVCQYPGCHESMYVDAHHIQHWSEGGETSLENLVTLCRFHHAQLHRGCFEIRVDEVSTGSSRTKSAPHGTVQMVKTPGEGWRLYLPDK